MQNVKIQINDLEFDCRLAGNQSNTMLVFLHGFPETSHMWIPLMEHMASEGYFCIAPDLRGYSKNACPRGRKNYKIDLLCSDIVAITSSFGKNAYHLIGHDWGAVIGWKLVFDSPNKILSWTSLSVPHIKGFMEAINTSSDQQYRSRYIKRFQWPLFPEYQIRKKDFQIFKKLWKNSSKEEIDNYLKVFRRKRSLTASLNYYRANFDFKKAFNIGKISTPTLFIWGNKDMALGQDAVQYGHQYIVGPYTFIELDTGHWLVQTAFKEILQQLKKHIAKFEINEKN